jgi:ribosomal protein S12 methylthiotransferase accessory factor
VSDELDTLARTIGVTRLARLTGLDRLGVEVVGAVRPRGHVLQVSQGKGWTLAQARRSALGEALELHAAETPDPSRLHFGPATREALFDVGGLSTAWIEGQRLAGGRCLVPAQAVYCPPAGRCWLGPEVVRWRSNGLGAHPRSRRAAEEHAVLELLERDALARVLPRGWTVADARQRLVRAPRVIEAALHDGFEAYTFDVTPPGARVSTAGVLLFDVHDGPVPLTAGYACRRRWDDAAEAAFLEAAQSRLTEIHGAREDVLTGERDGARGLLAALRRATPAPAPRRRFDGPLAAEARGPVAVVELSRRPFVVKAVTPSLLVSELL